MAGTGGMLAGAVLKMVGAAAGDRIMLQWGFKKDLEYMKQTLEYIEAALTDAERQSIEKEMVRLWLEDITQASYDISDMIDKFEVNTIGKSWFQKIKPEFVMASNIEKVKEKLDKIKENRDAYGFKTSSTSHLQQFTDDRETSGDVIKADILGRDQEKQIVIDLLVKASTSSDFVVLPIYGIGGIGKTTLAQLLFNDTTHFKSYERVWVYVSQTFSKTKIEGDIASQLEKQRSKITDIQESDAASKKILVVLDDLWENDDFKLDDLKTSLKIIGRGRKMYVIVTTRDTYIAQKIQTIEPHKIGFLSDDVSWTIIKQIVDFEKRTDKERLEVIGKEIAEKCGGVALAARAIGYILRSKSDFHAWVSVKDSGIWNVSTSESSPYDKVLASLKLSYRSMPSYLRLCFAYCAIFPKGHKMIKDELIYQWAALGFIKPSGESPTWQHGENCVKQLLAMSFLQRSDDTNGVTFFTMHDLVHDLARSVMGDELHDASKEFKQFVGRNCRYAFLADCSKPLNSYVTCPDKIRALHYLGCGETGHCSIGFSNATYIRVLDLGESCLEKLPPCIDQLKLLRYLNAPGIKDQVIPSCITKLSKLIYLNLRGSSKLSSLPESIGEMEALMYLDLSHCCEIEKLPESFGKLNNLLHLDLSDCQKLNGIPEALCSLTKLQHLNLSACYHLLSGSKGLHEVIGELTRLRYLNLFNSLNNFIHQEKQRVLIDNVLDKISTLLNLEHLNLSYGKFVTLPDSFCGLQRLHTLDLTGCFLLKELPKNMDHMISCLENVKSTEEERRIELRGKQSLKCFALNWTRGRNGYVEDMELLRELMPPSSLQQFELRGYNSVSFPAWLTNTAIYLPNLVSVQLNGLSRCSSLPPLGELANLQSLTLQAMPNIKKIDTDFCGDRRMKVFPRLRLLNISDMENLEEWTTTYSCGEGVADEFMFPYLRTLNIIRCPKLMVKPCPPRVEGTWIIEHSDGVLLQWEESAPVVLTCLQSLELRNCSGIQALPEQLGDCVSLKKLCISNCKGITSLPGIIQKLTNLESLDVRGCSELRKWCELKENKTKIDHVKEKNIRD